MVKRPDQVFANWQPGGHHYPMLNYPKGFEIVDAETDCSISKNETAALGLNTVSVFYSQDGHFLSLADSRAEFQIFDAKTLRLVVDVPTPYWSNSHATWRPETHMLLASYVDEDASGNLYERTLLFDADSGRVTYQHVVPTGSTFVWEPGWSLDGSAFVKNAGSGRSAMYTATTTILPFPEPAIGRAQLSPDKGYVSLTS